MYKIKNFVEKLLRNSILKIWNRNGTVTGTVQNRKNYSTLFFLVLTIQDDQTILLSFPIYNLGLMFCPFKIYLKAKDSF